MAALYLRQAVSLQPPSAEDRVEFRVGLYWVFVGSSGTEIGFSLKSFRVSLQYYSISTPYEFIHRQHHVNNIFEQTLP